MFDDILDQAIQRVERVQKSPDILSNFPFVFVHAMMWCLKGVGEQLRQVDQSYRAKDRKISAALQRDKWDVFRNLMIVRDRVTHNKILPIDCYTKSYRYGRGERLIIQAFVEFYKQLELLKAFLISLKDDSTYRNLSEVNIREMNFVCQDFLTIFIEKNRREIDSYVPVHLEITLQTIYSLEKIMDGHFLSFQYPDSLSFLKANQPMIFDAVQDCLETVAIIMGNANQLSGSSQMDGITQQTVRKLQVAADVCMRGIKDKELHLEPNMSRILSQQFGHNPLMLLYNERKKVRHEGKFDFSDQYVCGYVSYLLHIKKELRPLIYGWYCQIKEKLKRDRDFLFSLSKSQNLSEDYVEIDKFHNQYYRDYMVSNLHIRLTDMFKEARILEERLKESEQASHLAKSQNEILVREKQEAERQNAEREARLIQEAEEAERKVKREEELKQQVLRDRVVQLNLEKTTLSESHTAEMRTLEERKNALERDNEQKSDDLQALQDENSRLLLYIGDLEGQLSAKDAEPKGDPPFLAPRLGVS